MDIASRALRVGFTVLICLCGLAETPARADEIPTVTMTSVGPDRDIPVDRSFYVAGSASDTVEVAQAVLVRKGERSLWGRLWRGTAGPSCTALGEALKIKQPSDLPLEPGQRDVTVAFTNATDYTGSVALISSPWERSKNKDATTYKTLIDHDPDFFVRGRSFCLFVLLKTVKKEVDEDFWPEQIKKLVTAVTACDGAANEQQCLDEAGKAYEERIQDKVEKLDPKEQKRIKDQLPKLKEAAKLLAGAALDFWFARRDAVQIVKPWAESLEVAATTPPPYVKPDVHAPWSSSKDDALARAIVTLLERSGDLQNKVAKSGTEYFTLDGKIQVRWVSILDDRKRIQVASTRNPSKVGVWRAEVGTDALLVTDGVSLYDLLELAEGRIHVGGKPVAIAALYEWLSSDASNLDPAWPKEKVDEIAGWKDRLDAIENAVERALVASRGFACPVAASPGKPGSPGSYADDAPHVTEGTRASALRHIGEWLRCELLVTCPAGKARWSEDVTCAAAGAADIWPGLTTPGESPLAVLATKLGSMKEQRDIWQAKRVGVAFPKVTETTESSAPTNLKIAFTQKTWVFSYLTPVAGYAQVPRGQDSFSLSYLGVQLHFVPNPVDDVLWSNGFGRDFWRSFALEVGVAPKIAAFGPDNRYSGPSALPPILFGVAFHVIPYTSITLGGLLLDRRSSTLTEEAEHLSVLPFVGLNVQANIPDLVRGLSNGGQATKVEK